MGVQLVDEHKAWRQAMRQWCVTRDDLQEAAINSQFRVARCDARLKLGVRAHHLLRRLEQQPRLVATGRADVDRRLGRGQQREQPDGRE